MKTKITIFLLLSLFGFNELSMACTPFTPTISANGPTTFCVGNSVILNAGSYASYVWSTGETTATIMVTTTGTYSVTVTDGLGCTGENSAMLNAVPSPVPMITSYPYSNLCSSSYDTLTVTGSYISYLWSNSSTSHYIQAHIANTYTVTVTDANGCTGSASYTLAVLNCCAQFYIFPDTIVHHYYITSNASGTGPLTYDWDWGDASPHDLIPYPTHTYASTGVYNICLTITDSTGCTNSYCHNNYPVARTSSGMAWVTVRNPNITTGIKENEASPFTIFPNPASNSVTIHRSNNSSNQPFMITDVLGNVVCSRALNNAIETIDISTLSSGIYFYEWNGKRGKIVKE
ncbi:MAG: T9SS type A sorting domain-containing protein [Bacteroidota bacterium]